MTESIITGIQHGVATLTLNRPELHNAFDDRLIHDLTGALRRMDSHAGVHVVVLAAEGKSFSAGADLNYMRRMAGYSEADNRTDARRLAELMHTLHTLSKPTVARVHGAAIGGGVGLVACCDIAIASTRASFCLSEVRLGLIPAIIGPYVVGALGARQARRYMISAERFDATEARRIGLVHEVVEPEALDDRVATMLGTLEGNGPRAMAAAKDLVAAVAHGPVDETLIEDTARRIATLRASNEGREGIAAFLDKRRPDWLKD